MSHSKERKEKICLNCKAHVYGRFCHSCGQENIEIKETFWHLITHFVYDITHFDGKFFSTVKYLLFKPGFLSAEYVKGKRMSYLNPVKMYVFTSAFFFLFFFTFVANEETIKITKPKDKLTYDKALRDIDEKREDLQEVLAGSKLPIPAKKLIESNLALLEEDWSRLKRDTTNLENLNIYNESDINLRGTLRSKKEYDSVQQTLPPEKKDGWLPKKIQYKKYESIDKYGNNNRAIFNALFNKFFHFFPQVLFLSLPLFALFLKLLYRKKKEYYYADHAIYTIHLYCAMFLMIFFLIILSKLDNYSYLGWVRYISIVFGLYILWYIYKSMRNFYNQSGSKTLVKYLLLILTSTFMLLFLSIAFFIFSAYTL